MLVFLMVGDEIVAFAAWWAAWLLADWMGAVSPELSTVIPAAAFSLVLIGPLFSRFGLHEPKRIKNVAFESIDMLKAVFVIWALAYVFSSFTQVRQIPRSMMVMWGIFWFALAVMFRLAARLSLRYLRRRGWNIKTAAIIGTDRLGQKLHEVLKQNPWTGIQPRYFVDDGRQEDQLMGLPVRSPLDRVDEILQAEPVDIAFIAMPAGPKEEIEAVLNALAKTNVDIRVVPDLLSFHFLKHTVAELDNLPIISLAHTPQLGWNSLLKRLFDVVVSTIGLVVLAIPMLLIAVAIKLANKGPVFYVQTRAGLACAPFRMIKFRTMRHDPDSQQSAAWTTPDDPRVTRIGRLLRRTSLDELPQLLNVFLGQMSIVGPRPERPELVEEFRTGLPRYMLRHHVKGGMTGWAQVHGLRGQSSLRKRVQYDLYYIANWTFGLDVRICLMTLFRGFVNKNAY
jgi:Undecaprenyl-phosphate glucose phosphotransferase